MTELDRLREQGWLLPEQDFSYTLAGNSVPAVRGDGTYPEMGFDVLLAGDVSGYWFDHRSERIATALRESGDQTLWDIGAGLGANASRLNELGFEVLCVEPDLRATVSMRENGLVAFAGTLEQMKFPTGSLNAIGLFDVLEHLREPATLLAEVHRVLAPHGRLLITVPALPILWSEEDEFAGHELRYTRDKLSRLAFNTGFREVTSEFLFGSLAIAALMSRTVPYRLGIRRSEAQVRNQMLKQLNPSPLVQSVLRKILATESALAKQIRLPFGSSIFATWTKAR
ncbi:MAG: class I SAM-dependent methyltransferase [Actinomycetes bacterium]